MIEKEERIEYPIQTVREGNKITKICVEDCYKMLKDFDEVLLKHYNNCVDISDGVIKEVPNADGRIGEGCLIIGRGVSQPCLTDAFDEEIGNNIAFMKAKINANMKKRNILIRLWKEIGKVMDNLDEKIFKLEDLIDMDVIGIRKYNPEYLSKWCILEENDENYEV